ncbi:MULTISPECIES: hypothetical protein [Rhodobacterales]|uniref:hypothetical protein n=1 Tax=Rhodobacterales TaxID=204455 RepID=UPI0009E7AA6E|nr:hypothetical protein [Phaeobacter sp. CECT 5382]
MKRHLIMLCLAAGSLQPVSAQAFTAKPGVRVNPVDSQVFEVIPTSGGDLRDFWCGAAEYARRVKGAGWTDQVYVVRGRGASVTTGRRTAVQFTLSPAEVAEFPRPQGWLRWGINPGDRMSVQQARGYCHQRETERR